MEAAADSILREEILRLFGREGPRQGQGATLEEGERRDISALFLDFRGFTELSERLDHESVHLLTGGIMKALAGVVEYHAGYVDKFEGDRIMALFGATGSAENDSVRAVSCGIRMLETMDQIDRTLSGRGICISASVGIDSGVATVAPDPSGHVTATGRCVNIASRLEEAAPPNTVLVSGEVRRRCGDLFEWNSAGDLMLKGIETAVPAFSPSGPGAARQRRWELAASLARSPMYGRSGEMSMLEGLWAQQMDNSRTNRRGGAVHIFAGIEAEGGMGKSRLLFEFLNSRSEDFLLLKGGTMPFAQPPMSLWTSILRNHLGTRPGDPSEADVLKSRLRELERDAASKGAGISPEEAFPLLAGLLGAGDGTQETGPDWSGKKHEETVLALRDFVRALSSTRSRTVLLLEDLQWIDPASRQTLMFILRNCDTGVPLLFLAAFRPEGEWSMPESGDPVHGYAGMFPIMLERLDLNSCSSILSSMTGTRDTERRLLDFFYERSHGNPFIMEELFLDAAESGVIDIGGTGTEVVGDLSELAVPVSVSGLIRNRIDRLPGNLRRALQLGAVLGREFEAGLFRTVHSSFHPEEDQEGLLEQLGRLRLLETTAGTASPGLGFRHALTRDAVYETILFCNRNILHQAAAGAILELHADDAEDHAAAIAHHYRRSGNLRGAFDWGLVAMRRAYRRYQLDEVIDWSGRLLEWLDGGSVPQDVEAELDILLKLQQAQNRKGMREAQEETLRRVLEKAEVLGNPRWRVLALNSLGTLHRMTGRFEEALEDLKTAIETAGELGDSELETAAMTSLGIVFLQLNRLEEAESHLRAAHSKALGSGDRRNEAYILGNLGILARRRGLPEEAMQAYRRAREIFEEMGDLRNAGANLSNIAVMQFSGGMQDEAEASFKEALAIARRVGDRWFECKAMANMGVFYRDTGADDEVEKYLLPALEMAVANGERSQECGILTVLAEFHSARMETSRARDYILKARTLASELGPGEELLKVLLLSGRLCILQEDYADAIEELGRVLAMEGTTLPVGVRLRTLVMLGFAEMNAGRPEAAADRLRAVLSMDPGTVDLDEWTLDLLRQLEAGV
ncbi:MAG: hypothetical protein AVO35_13035 [Candidatus Aegiribacteria sp. MLS_C]|nr:MAG: hypothetical protein AVO35_13035 [Candidatus Aegiribacteria sp. MLS_C]